jgi:hypothetical protein
VDKGVRLDEHLTSEQAQAVSNELMQKWLSNTDPAKAAAWMKEQATANRRVARSSTRMNLRCARSKRI